MLYLNDSWGIYPKALWLQLINEWIKVEENNGESCATAASVCIACKLAVWGK